MLRETKEMGGERISAKRERKIYFLMLNPNLLP